MLFRLAGNKTDAIKTGLYKLTKLLYFLSIQGPLIKVDPVTISPPSVNNTNEENIFINAQANVSSDPIHSGTQDVLTFLQSIRIYYYPSNSGSWTVNMTYLLNVLVREMSHHIGKAMVEKVFHSCDNNNNNNNADINSDGNNIYVRCIHSTTMKFLGSNLIPFIIECLYGTNPMVSQLAVSTLMQLVCIDSNYGHYIIPFLLSALDPDAVTRSHQAPSAIHTISSLCKHLLYPNPVILSYLPSIMDLCLSGIDPNDVRKTMLTLTMYSNILMWIPVKRYDDQMNSTIEKNKKIFPPSYLSYVEQQQQLSPVDNNHTVYHTSCTVEKYNQLLSSLGNSLGDWSLLFIDKVFALLDAKELPREGKRNGFSLSPFIFETMDIFFAALDDIHLDLISDKIILKIKNLSNFNAAKEYAKILDSMISFDSTLLKKVLPILLSYDFNQFPFEKIAFYLRILGGTIRRCHHENLIPYLNSNLFELLKFSNHSEKIVRKCTGKLLRDILRCLCSFYVSESTPNQLSSTEIIPLGSAIKLESIQVRLNLYANV